MTTWLTLEDACQQLQVRPQTVYAYVSRGKIDVAPDPADSRRSFYRAEDVAALQQRKQSGRKRETVATNTLFGAEPSIPTALSSFWRGRLHYRGQDAIQLAERDTLEAVAQRLWDTARPVVLAAPGVSAPAQPGRTAAFLVLAQRAATGHATLGRTARALHEEAQALVGHLAVALGAASSGPGEVHQRLAAAWGQPAEVADRLRQAMVLLADHEITSSAFATRIAASTGASLPACLLAGLATFSGPLHGDASGRVRALFDDVARVGGQAVLDRHLGAGLPLAGFGHPLYAEGDPRAAALLARLSPPPAIADFMARASAATGLQPNIDFALATLVATHRLPADGAFALFALARSVGLLAHGMEQLSMGQVIRPRGRYTGPAPASAVPR
ncbi:citrate synthase family protein [Ideonella livida]|uniref:citrate synthase (unknown stereospecificity) n=1 Tax=Ideonella livida TaxID=2707176 RepID=A0A7C9TK02_9BURK|nr:citrate synthase family protein [Ideonella livida]NDY92118.1 helix-turn-helix domain-containing protein [Ideonella livida]